MACLPHDDYEALRTLALKSLMYENSDRRPMFGDRVVATYAWDDSKAFEGELLEVTTTFRADGWWDVTVWLVDDDGDCWECDSTGMGLVKTKEVSDEP